MFRTNGRTYVSKFVKICISVLLLKFTETKKICIYIYCSFWKNRNDGNSSYDCVCNSPPVYEPFIMTFLREYVGQCLCVGSSRKWQYLTRQRAWYFSHVQVSADKCILSFIADPSWTIRTRFRHVFHEWRYEFLISISLNSVNGVLKKIDILEISESVNLRWGTCWKWRYRWVFWVFC